MNVSDSTLLLEDLGEDDGRGIPKERRNCFVALTHARKSLTLTYARSYFRWENRRSRFLAEMGSLNNLGNPNGH